MGTPEARDPVVEAYKRDLDVDFIIVGGVAAVAHGSARLTQDVDVVYARDPGNLDRVVAALAPHAPYLRGAPPGLPFRWDRPTRPDAGQ